MLKQQYGNIKAKGSETLEQTFNRMQVIVSHLEFMDIEIEQDDLNQRFLTSLAPEWIMHIIIWRNISDLDTMSLVDLYNHLKVYEPKVQKKLESNSQNMAFISSAKNSSGKEEVNTASIPTASTNVSPASANIRAASISQDTACAYRASQSNKFGDSYKAPKDDVATASASDGSAKKKGRTVAVTTEDMQKRRNDTFGGNEATKKTKKNMLKQQYGNIKAKGSETLEQTFNRMQVIVSHLEFMDIEIEQDDLNQRFLTSLAPEWIMHIIIWRNISDLDTMSLVDLYNHLKVYEPEVQKKLESNSQNMAFISSAKNSSGKEEVNTASIPTASTNANRYWKRTGKKITIQGTDVDGFDKLKVECFNCHKIGHFARECKAPRSQDKGRRDNYRQGSNVEEQALKALMAIDGVEARLVEFKNQEVKFCEKIRGLELKVEFKTNKIEILTNELDHLKKENEGLDSKLTGFQSASKDLDNLLESQGSNKNKEGLGYIVVPPSCSSLLSSQKGYVLDRTP
nr:hypothetical protein [Tanacetum cinerariifolium]